MLKKPGSLEPGFFFFLRFLFFVERDYIKSAQFENLGELVKNTIFVA